ncbi:MAG: carbohydrate kinase family protein [Anaerolineales bacterium]
MDKQPATFLMLGEAVVDLISTGIVTSLDDAERFEKFAGGEVANLAANLAGLGFSVLLGSCLGQDSFGTFHQRMMEDTGIDLSLIQTTDKAPTTLIPVARQTGTPDFIVYRGADCHLAVTDELLDAAGEVKAIHTSAFALSRNPCRETITAILQSLEDRDKILSLDPNFHPAVGPDIPDFLDFLKDFMQFATVIKPSLDDCRRIFGKDREPQEYLKQILDLGPEIVVLTLGSGGSLLGTATGERYHIQPRPVPVCDVTGAGDAYWSGLLAGLVSGFAPLDAARLGQAVAEHKIGFVGPIQKYLPLSVYQTSAGELKVKVL